MACTYAVLKIKKYNTNYWIFPLVFLATFICCNHSDNDDLSKDSITFTVIGDVPYNGEQRAGLIKLIAKHNSISNSEFVVHVGDIRPGSAACDEYDYQDIDNILRKFQVPTFVVLGDNEYSGCTNPLQGLEYWHKYFLHYNENWSNEIPIKYQTERIENFSWVKNKVLFIGINLIGSSVHDKNEWQNRLLDNGNWVHQLVESQKNSVEAVVIFGHANMIEEGPSKFVPFTDLFTAAAQSFGKPVLYVQGDGHYWIMDKPWKEQNITRVQLIGGATAAKIIVDIHRDYPFIIDENFLD
ncbi:MAG: metallophosphoesterase [Arenibacter sp.]